MLVDEESPFEGGMLTSQLEPIKSQRRFFLTVGNGETASLLDGVVFNEVNFHPRLLLRFED